jgi:threonine synthase
VRAFNEGKETAAPWKDARTIASGLRVPQALADFLMLRVLRESRGTAVAVSDEEMLADIRLAGRLEGLFFCPEGAACIAALRRLANAGWIGASDSVLIFNTASGLKYLTALHTRM